MVAQLVPIDRGESLPGLLSENRYVLPLALSFERWQEIGSTLQQMHRSINVVKLQVSPGGDSGPTEASTTREDLAMHFDPTTLSPLPIAAGWWHRFVTKFVVSPNGCWHWQRYIDRDGYGRFAIAANDVWYAHRAVYVAIRGPISGETLDHECHTADLTCPGGPCLHRRCVNPWHVEPVTVRVNVLRGRSLVAQEARATACVNGHPFTIENTYEWRGHRYCRACRKNLQRGLKRVRRKRVAS